MAHAVVVKRRRYTDALRKQILDEASAPGASVAEVARRHGINHNVIFHWRRKLAAPALLPVAIMEAPAVSRAMLASPEVCTVTVSIGPARVQIEAAGVEMVRAVLAALRT